MLIEPSPTRRRLIGLCLAAGLATSGYLLWALLAAPHGADISGSHIVYQLGGHRSPILALAYVVATGLPLLLSSHRTVVVLGVIVLVGSVVAYIFYWEALVSVWCFFAAGASMAILCHFELSRRWHHRNILA